jgi:hypothetical protein
LIFDVCYAFSAEEEDFEMREIERGFENTRQDAVLPFD